MHLQVRRPPRVIDFTQADPMNNIENKDLPENL